MNEGGLHLGGIQQIMSDFIVAELLLALEESGVLGKIANGDSFSVRTVAKDAGISDDMLRAACDFLAERGLCEKVTADRYRLLGAYDDIKSSVNYILAYKTMYESIAGLMDNSKRYGSDIRRNGIYYRRGLDAMVAHSFPFLFARLKELGARRITGIGANALGFLRAASEEIRPCACIGVVGDEERAELENERGERLPSSDVVRIIRGEPGHPEQFSAEAAADALLGIAVFHDFRPEEKLRAVLGAYKRVFPSSKLFLLEFDVPNRDEPRGRGVSPAHYLRSVSRLTHALKRETGRRSFREWASIIEDSGWHLAHAERFESGLVIYECS